LDKSHSLVSLIKFPSMSYKNQDQTNLNDEYSNLSRRNDRISVSNSVSNLLSNKRIRASIANETERVENIFLKEIVSVSAMSVSV